MPSMLTTAHMGVEQRIRSEHYVGTHLETSLYKSTHRDFFESLLSSRCLQACIELIARGCSKLRWHFTNPAGFNLQHSLIEKGDT